MSNYRKIATFKVPDPDPAGHLGRLGEITYRDGALYYHDGEVPGGELIAGGNINANDWNSITGKPSSLSYYTTDSIFL